MKINWKFLIRGGLIGVMLVMMGIGVLLFNGKIEPCRQQQMAGLGKTAEETFQLVNLFLAGEKNEVRLSDLEVTEFIKTRLDPRVKFFQTCFFDDKVMVVARLTNRLGWGVNVIGEAKLEFIQSHLYLSQVRLNLGQLALTGKWLERKANQRLGQIHAGGNYQIKLEPGYVNLSR